MTLMDRRRALMGIVKDAPIDYGTPFLAPFSSWHLTGGTVISDDSITINTNRYAYSIQNVLTTYSNLVGKTVIIDFDVTATTGFYVQIGVNSRNQSGYGISSVVDRITISGMQGLHYHAEIEVGDDYTTTHTGYYFTVCLRSSADSPNITVSNFRCGYK